MGRFGGQSSARFAQQSGSSPVTRYSPAKPNELPSFCLQFACLHSRGLFWRIPRTIFLAAVDCIAISSLVEFTQTVPTGFQFDCENWLSVALIRALLLKLLTSGNCDELLLLPRPYRLTQNRFEFGASASREPLTDSQLVQCLLCDISFILLATM